MEGVMKKNIVNHIDSDVENNSPSNLEWVSNRENINHGNSKVKNTSSKAGVYFKSREQKWASDIQINGRKLWIGFFRSENEAASTYNWVLKQLGIEDKYISNNDPVCYNPSLPARLQKHLNKTSPGVVIKSVVRMDMDNKIVDEWASIIEMCSSLDMDRRTVQRCLEKRPNFNSHKGFTFKYK